MTAQLACFNELWYHTEGKDRFEIDAKDLEKKPTKEEYAVARYLKQKLPEKKTTLLGHKVEYFIASKAVDCLLESPWAKKPKKGELNFNNRDAAVNFMARLLDHKLFHRAKKIVVQKDPKKKKKDEEGTESGKEKESKKSKGKSEASEKKDEKESKDGKDGKKESSEVEKKKEKKKIKLDMHLEQIFIDSNEPYVWIYDPIPIRTWITGALMVVAAVLICLFPLWPQTIRHYIYYLSVAAAFFLVFIIGLAVFRLIFFVLVWIVTFGKHHIWLLPNLTEDVGFFESFWPLYKYEYKGKVKDEKDKESSDKKHKDESKEEESQDKEGDKSDASSTDQDRKDANHSESEESGEEKQKAENDFEMIDADDANDSRSEEEDRKTK